MNITGSQQYTRVSRKQVEKILAHLSFPNQVYYKAVTVVMIPSLYHPAYDFENRAITTLYSNAEHYSKKSPLERFQGALVQFTDNCLHPQVGTKTHFYIKNGETNL